MAITTGGMTFGKDWRKKWREDVKRAHAQSAAGEDFELTPEGALNITPYISDPSQEGQYSEIGPEYGATAPQRPVRYEPQMARGTRERDISRQVIEGEREQRAAALRGHSVPAPEELGQYTARQLQQIFVRAGGAEMQDITRSEAWKLPRAEVEERLRTLHQQWSPPTIEDYTAGVKTGFEDYSRGQVSAEEVLARRQRLGLPTEQYQPVPMTKAHERLYAKGARLGLTREQTYERVRTAIEQGVIQPENWQAQAPALLEQQETGQAYESYKKQFAKGTAAEKQQGYLSPAQFKLLPQHARQRLAGMVPLSQFVNQETGKVEVPPEYFTRGGEFAYQFSAVTQAGYQGLMPGGNVFTTWAPGKPEKRVQTLGAHETGQITQAGLQQADFPYKEGPMSERPETLRQTMRGAFIIGGDIGGPGTALMDLPGGRFAQTVTRGIKPEEGRTVEPVQRGAVFMPGSRMALAAGMEGERTGKWRYQVEDVIQDPDTQEWLYTLQRSAGLDQARVALKSLGQKGQALQADLSGITNLQGEAMNLQFAVGLKDIQGAAASFYFSNKDLLAQDVAGLVSRQKGREISPEVINRFQQMRSYAELGSLPLQAYMQNRAEITTLVHRQRMTEERAREFQEAGSLMGGKYTPTDVKGIVEAPVMYQALVGNFAQLVSHEYPFKQKLLSYEEMGTLQRANPQEYQRLYQQGAPLRQSYQEIMNVALANTQRYQAPQGTRDLSQEEAGSLYSMARQQAALIGGIEDPNKVPSRMISKQMLDVMAQDERYAGPSRIALPGGGQVVLPSAGTMQRMSAGGKWEDEELSRPLRLATEFLGAYGGGDQDRMAQLLRDYTNKEGEVKPGLISSLTQLGSSGQVARKAIGTMLPEGQAIGDVMHMSMALRPNEAYIPQLGDPRARRGLFGKMSGWFTDAAQVIRHPSQKTRAYESGSGVIRLNREQAISRGMNPSVAQLSPEMVGSLAGDADGDKFLAYIRGDAAVDASGNLIAKDGTNLGDLKTIQRNAFRAYAEGAGRPMADMAGHPEAGGFLTQKQAMEKLQEAAKGRVLTPGELRGEYQEMAELRGSIGTLFNRFRAPSGMIPERARDAFETMWLSSHGYAQRPAPQLPEMQVVHSLFNAGLFKNPEKWQPNRTRLLSGAWDALANKGKGQFRGFQTGLAGLPGIFAEGTWALRNMKGEGGDRLLGPEALGQLFAGSAEAAPGLTEAFAAYQQAAGGPATTAGAKAEIRAGGRLQEAVLSQGLEALANSPFGLMTVPGAIKRGYEKAVVKGGLSIEQMAEDLQVTPQFIQEQMGRYTEQQQMLTALSKKAVDPATRAKAFKQALGMDWMSGELPPEQAEQMQAAVAQLVQRGMRSYGPTGGEEAGAPWAGPVGEEPEMPPFGEGLLTPEQFRSMQAQTKLAEQGVVETPATPITQRLSQMVSRQPRVLGGTGDDLAALAQRYDFSKAQGQMLQMEEGPPGIPAWQSMSLESRAKAMGIPLKSVGSRERAAGAEHVPQVGAEHAEAGSMQAQAQQALQAIFKAHGGEPGKVAQAMQDITFGQRTSSPMRKALNTFMQSFPQSQRAEAQAVWAKEAAAMGIPMKVGEGGQMVHDYQAAAGSTFTERRAGTPQPGEATGQARGEPRDLLTGYHVTHKENLPSIIEKGLEPKTVKDWGLEGIGPSVFLAPTVQHARYWASSMEAERGWKPEDIRTLEVQYDPAKQRKLPWKTNTQLAVSEVEEIKGLYDIERGRRMGPLKAEETPQERLEFLRSAAQHATDPGGYFISGPMRGRNADEVAKEMAKLRMQEILGESAEGTAGQAGNVPDDVAKRIDRLRTIQHGVKSPVSPSGFFLTGPLAGERPEQIAREREVLEASMAAGGSEAERAALLGISDPSGKTWTFPSAETKANNERLAEIRERLGEPPEGAKVTQEKPPPEFYEGDDPGAFEGRFSATNTPVESRRSAIERGKREFMQGQRGDIAGAVDQMMGGQENWALFRRGDRLTGYVGEKQVKVTAEHIDMLENLNKGLKTWAEIVKDNEDSGKDFSKAQVQFAKELQKQVKALPDIQRAVTRMGGMGLSPYIQPKLDALKEAGAPDMMAAAEAAIQGQTMRQRMGAATGEGWEPPGGGRWGRFLAGRGMIGPPGPGGRGVGGPLGAMSRGLSGLFSGWELMRMRRIWSMTGQPVFSQMIPAAAQAGMASWGAATAIGGYEPGAAPGGVTGGLMAYQAAQRQSTIEAGRTGYQVWGTGPLGAISQRVRGAQAIFGPAAGQAMLAGTIGTMGATALGVPTATAAATVGLPITLGAGALLGGYAGVRYAMGEAAPTPENQLAEYWRQREGGGGIDLGRGIRRLGAAFRGDVKVNWWDNPLALIGDITKGGQVQEAVQAGVGQQLAHTQLGKVGLGERPAVISGMAQQLREGGGMWENLDEQQIAEMLQQAAAYMPELQDMSAQQIINAPPRALEIMATTGRTFEQFQPMAQQLNLGPYGASQALQQFGYMSNADLSQQQYALSKWAPLTQVWGSPAGESLLRGAGSPFTSEQQRTGYIDWAQGMLNALPETGMHAGMAGSWRGSIGEMLTGGVTAGIEEAIDKATGMRAQAEDLTRRGALRAEAITPELQRQMMQGREVPMPEQWTEEWVNQQYNQLPQSQRQGGLVSRLQQMGFTGERGWQAVQGVTTPTGLGRLEQILPMMQQLQTQGWNVEIPQQWTEENVAQAWQQQPLLQQRYQTTGQLQGIGVAPDMAVQAAQAAEDVGGFQGLRAMQGFMGGDQNILNMVGLANQMGPFARTGVGDLGMNVGLMRDAIVAGLEEFIPAEYFDSVMGGMDALKPLVEESGLAMGTTQMYPGFAKGYQLPGGVSQAAFDEVAAAAETGGRRELERRLTTAQNAYQDFQTWQQEQQLALQESSQFGGTMVNPYRGETMDTRGTFAIQRELRDLNRNFEDWQRDFNDQQRQLSRQQFMENWGVRAERMPTQFQWQREDLAFQGNQAALQYGWQMQDIDEQLRFATGRQRRGLLRQQERATIMYGMGEGRRETMGERIDTREKWAQEDLEREKRQFEERFALQDQYQDRYRRHVEERRRLEDELQAIREFQARFNLDAANEQLNRYKDLQEQQRAIQEAYTAMNQSLQDAGASQQQLINTITWMMNQFKLGGGVRTAWNSFIAHMQSSLNTLATSADRLSVDGDGGGGGGGHRR